MMRSLRRASPLVLLLGFQVAAIVGLHALGSAPYLQLPAMAETTAWLRTSTVDEILAPILRMTALAVAYWMLTSTMLFALAQLSRIPSAIAATSMFTLPSVRRVVDGAVAVSIATTSIVGVSGGAAMAQSASAETSLYAQTDLSVTGAVGSPRPGDPAANEQDRSDVTQPEETTTTTSSTTEAPTTTSSSTTSTTAAPTTTSSSTPVAPGAGDPAVSSPRPGAPAASTTTSTTAAPAAEAPSSETEVAGAQEHRVAAGDNLWAISRNALAEATNRSASDLTDAEIRDYWLAVIEQNRDSLRSGDPHWIFPGEVINLPEVGVVR